MKKEWTTSARKVNPIISNSLFDNRGTDDSPSRKRLIEFLSLPLNRPGKKKKIRSEQDKAASFL